MHPVEEKTPKARSTTSDSHNGRVAHAGFVPSKELLGQRRLAQAVSSERRDVRVGGEDGQRSEILLQADVEKRCRSSRHGGDLDYQYRLTAEYAGLQHRDPTMHLSERAA